MEKVKLTQEQVTALEKAINDYGIDTTMNDHSPHNWGGFLTPLNELKTHQMARALYIGYEVEETIKIGDWVVKGYEGNRGEVIGKVEGITESTYGIEELHGIWSNFLKYKTIIAYEGDIRHATPEEIAEEKQRRWWAKHDREVWELKEGDVIKGTFGQVREVCRVDEAGTNVTLPNYTAFSKEELSGWVVVCFAEDRKDLEGENE